MVDINPRSWGPGQHRRKKKSSGSAGSLSASLSSAAAEVSRSSSGRIRKVVKFGHGEDTVPRGNFHRTPEEAAHLQALKDKFRDFRGFYPTGGQASSVKWLTARIAEFERGTTAGGTEREEGGFAEMEEAGDGAGEQRDLERDTEREAKEEQRRMVAEDQRRIREHKQREKTERMAEKLWGEADDLSLANAIGSIFYSRYGRHGAWPDVPGTMGTNRSHDSCRHRWNVIKTQPAIEAAVQLAAREHDREIERRAKEAGEELVELAPLGPERGSTSPRAGPDDSSRSTSALRQSGGSACNRCKRLKRKCDGGLPCKACIEKGLGHECNYDHLGMIPPQRPSPVNVPERESTARESCRICKGAAGICRKWNMPGHLMDPLKPVPIADGTSPTRVFASYDSSLTSPAAQGTDWSVEEDTKLRDAVTQIGTSDWTRVAEIVGNSRASQACRGRWLW